MKAPAVRLVGGLGGMAAGITAAATALVAAALFPPNPLPRTVERVTYFLDNRLPDLARGRGDALLLHGKRDALSTVVRDYGAR